MGNEDLIVACLARMEHKVDTCIENTTLCRIDIAGLKVKSGIWGAIAGMIPVAIGLIMLKLGIM